MNFYKKLFFLFLLIIFLLSSFLFFSFKNNKNIDQEIVLVSNWILNSQREDGFFKYNYVLDNDSYIESKNIVRQVGTFYSVIKTYNYNKNPVYLDSIYNFKNEIDKNIKYKYTSTNVKIAYIEYDYTSMVNTNALYIISLVEMKKAGLNLTQRDLDILELLIEGIKYMAVEDGGFRYIYNLDLEKNRIDYYGSGEAMFALSSYYHYIDNDSDLFEFTNSNFENFYISLNDYEFDNNYKSFFLWGLLYLKENYEITNDEKWKNYMVEMVNKALLYRENNLRCKNEGCIDYPLTSGEYAYFEGIVGVYDIIILDENIDKSKLENYIDLTFKNILDMQITSYFDLFFDHKKLFFKNINKVKGGFCDTKKCNNLRIDYSQHALCSLISISESKYIFK